MALTPNDEIHALQIQAGILGRKAGHAFEDTIAEEINALRYPLKVCDIHTSHVSIGDPALLLLNYVASHFRAETIIAARALSTGALATSEEGTKWLEHNGVPIRRCKSDILLTLTTDRFDKNTYGISTKQCNNRTPTNAQLYFTTARGFSKLLIDNAMLVSQAAITAMRQFCGDQGFRPLDRPALLEGNMILGASFGKKSIPQAARNG